MSTVVMPKGATLLTNLSAEHVATVEALAHPVALEKGANLFEVGDPADRIYVIAEGAIELVLPIQLEGGHHPVVVEVASAGDTVGWSCFVAPNRYTLGGRAATDGRALAIERGALLEACRTNPELGFELMHNLMTTLAERLGRLHAMWVREVHRNVEREER